MDKEKNKPEDADWKQQRLAAWQPLLTPNWVIGTMLTVGIVFLAIGIALVVTSNQVVEVTARYDNVCALNSLCTLSIPITSTMQPPIYVYYALTNYFQNHRRYVSSVSYTQLQGQLTSDISLCTPLEYNANGTIIVPCGLIANSFFNDTFAGSLCTGSTCTNLTGNSWSNYGIAWQSDIDDMFKYVDPIAAGLTNVAADGHVLPRVNNTDLIVWMRVAGLPSFRKLYRVINDQTLTAGQTLQVTVLNQYPVSSFSGTKTVVVTTGSFLGGKNGFLGWVYIAIALTTLIIGLAFLARHLLKPRKLGDMQYFHWAGVAKELDDPD